MTPASTRRAPDPRAARTRAAILDAAVALFVEHGFEATSMARIAERANVGMSSIYLHFESKAVLVDGLVHDALVRHGFDGRPAGTSPSADDVPAPTCLAVGASLLRFAEQEPAAARALVAVATEPTVAGPRSRQFLEVLVDQIEAAVRESSPAGASRVALHASVALWLSIVLGLVDQVVRRDGLAIQPDVAAEALKLAGRWAESPS
jgi:AcrR family transcriptional regulator